MIELTNDTLIKIKAICIHLESAGILHCTGGKSFVVFSLGIRPENIDGLLIFKFPPECTGGTGTYAETELLPGWRWRIDRLLEAVPDNKPITFWGWGVDHTGYIFPILGNDSDCERVEFVSPTPK